MRTITKHIISICLAACVLLAMSCSGNDDMTAEAGGGSGSTTLVLHIGTVGQSRAAKPSNAPDCELMHSLRIIILGNNGRVEHNFYTSFEDTALKEEYTHSILNLPVGQKTIYLIANEESVENINGGNQSLHDFLEAIKTGDTNAGEKIDGIHFEPDYTKNIPISARHDIFIPLNSTQVERTLYMVRVATKFTVNFVNYRDEDVKVNDFTISSIADQNYLMARVGENGGLFKEHSSWIEWLKYVSDISQENPYDPSLADQYGWVKEYDLPQSAQTDITYHYNTTGNASKDISVSAFKTDTNTPGETKVEDIYIPESMCLKAGEQKYGDQEYTMTFDIEERPNNSSSYILPNLRALFRNTHVLVTVRMNRTLPGEDNFLEVRVRTWEQGDKVDGGHWEEITY